LLASAQLEPCGESRQSHLTSFAVRGGGGPSVSCWAAPMRYFDEGNVAMYASEHKQARRLRLFIYVFVRLVGDSVAFTRRRLEANAIEHPDDAATIANETVLLQPTRGN